MKSDPPSFFFGYLLWNVSSSLMDADVIIFAISHCCRDVYRPILWATKLRPQKSTNSVVSDIALINQSFITPTGKTYAVCLGVKGVKMPL